MDNRNKIDAVQRMQDYIETHIALPISLHDLACAAGYSPWHSARLFKDLTGKTPFEYIRTLRLSRAALRLQNQDARIIDVAFDFIFDSHEGFTRAFSKEFGLTPKSLQKHPRPVRLFLPEKVRDAYPGINKGENTMSDKKKASAIFVQVIDRPARKLILKRGIKATDYYAYCEEVGCDIWEILTGIKDALYEPIGLWLPDHLIKPGTSLYVQGVEMPAGYAGPIPEGLEMIDLPPCKMMVFQGEPYDDDHYEDAIGEVWELIKIYNPELYGFQWADSDGPRFQLAPMGYRGYIEARPVRPLHA
ncbi:MAG: AraC family transcriptional regulator [Clostridiaceae bacterium]|nr:AraC family transcriptional regulator [Clostridiaceae bacterium]